MMRWVTHEHVISFFLPLSLSLFLARPSLSNRKNVDAKREREQVLLLIGSERKILFDLDEKRRRNVSLDMSREKRWLARNKASLGDIRPNYNRVKETWWIETTKNERSNWIVFCPTATKNQRSSQHLEDWVSFFFSHALTNETYGMTTIVQGDKLAQKRLISH